MPGAEVLKKSPNPIDKHVGSRVRMRRVLIGMSQERLGGALGLTFQQVQKYEKGTNRIGASRLQQIAGVLSVPPAFFFEDMPAGEGQPDASFSDDGAGFVVDFLSTAEGLLAQQGLRSHQGAAGPQENHRSRHGSGRRPAFDRTGTGSAKERSAVTVMPLSFGLPNVLSGSA